MNWLQQFFHQKWRYHLLFWLIYNGFWHVITSPRIFSWREFSISIVYAFCHISVSYFNIYFLMPRFLYRKQYLKYSALLVGNLLFFSGLLALLLYIVFSMVAPQSIPFFFQTTYLVGATLGSTFTTVFIVMVIKLVKRHLEMEKKATLLKEEKLATELKFLKSQLNPHFLFNALNSIYFLIKKDPEVAAEALAKFSDILRYQLYDCNENRIPIKQEIEYLENYINIARFSKNRLDLKVDLEHSLNGEQIAPLLLIPFVENAFKHVSNSKRQDNWLKIELKLHPNHLLDFKVENTCQNETNQDSAWMNDGGIGLPNVKRRLELLYPCHLLEFQKTGGTFKATLEIQL